MWDGDKGRDGHVSITTLMNREACMQGTETYGSCASSRKVIFEISGAFARRAEMGEVEQIEEDAGGADAGMAETSRARGGGVS